MRSERAPWKVTVVLFAAAIGVWLGVLGSHAPRLHASISGVAPQAAVVARPGPAAGDRRGRDGRAGPEVREPSVGPRSEAAGSEGEVSDRDGRSAPRLDSTSAPPRAAAAPQTRGPLLSDMWYASRAHEIYPTMTLAPNDRILTGFQISLRAVDAANETVTVTSLQDNTTQTATFSRANRLYFVETRLGDDGVDGETNNGDDGFILTDAEGHIVGP